MLKFNLKRESALHQMHLLLSSGHRAMPVLPSLLAQRHEASLGRQSPLSDSPFLQENFEPPSLFWRVTVNRQDYMEV